MKTLFALITVCLFFTGCTVRGGWPRFLRSGESPGWDAPKPDALPKTNTQAGMSDEQRLAMLTPQPDPAFQRQAPTPFDFNAHIESKVAPAVVAPPTTGRVLMITFTTPREYDGFNLYGGTNADRSDWRLIIETNATSIPIKADHGYFFFGLKAFLRNGIDGAETESTWGRVGP